ncbi:MAG: carbonic anhydrase family protein [Fuerstiella sp.]
MKRPTITAIRTVFIRAMTIPLTVASAQANEKSTTPRARVQSVLHHYFSKGTHTHEAEWGYTGKQGPAFWGTLSPKYHLATDGRKQSPIDIRTADISNEDLPPLVFRYRSEQLSVVNNGHTIQHNEQPGSFLQVGDKVYALEQFHAHVPSEHTINGKHADMEIHFVHKSLTGQGAVVAVMANADTEKSISIPVHMRLPQAGDAAVEPNHSRNPTDFIPKERHYFTYSGSFTTPPCTEGVRWIVMTSPIQIAPSALARFRQTLGRNIRPVQPLHGREVAISR